METTVRKFKSLVELHKFEKANRSLVIINMDYSTPTGLWTVTFSSL